MTRHLHVLPYDMWIPPPPSLDVLAVRHIGDLDFSPPCPDTWIHRFDLEVLSSEVLQAV